MEKKSDYKPIEVVKNSYNANYNNNPNLNSVAPNLQNIYNLQYGGMIPPYNGIPLQQPSNLQIPLQQPSNLQIPLQQPSNLQIPSQPLYNLPRLNGSFANGNFPSMFGGNLFQSINNPLLQPNNNLQEIMIQNYLLRQNLARNNLIQQYLIANGLQNNNLIKQAAFGSGNNPQYETSAQQPQQQPYNLNSYATSANQFNPGFSSINNQPFNGGIPLNFPMF